MQAGTVFFFFFFFLPLLSLTMLQTENYDLTFLSISQATRFRISVRKTFFFFGRSESYMREAEQGS